MKPLLQWKSNKYYIFWVCVFILRYPACKAHAPVRLYSISPRSEFGKKLLNTKWVFWFSLQLLSETFLILRRIERDMIINKYPLLLSDFNETRISSKDFRKIFKYKILRKAVQWDPSCSTRIDGLTDRHGEANNPFLVIFRKRLQNLDPSRTGIYVFLFPNTKSLKAHFLTRI